MDVHRSESSWGGAHVLDVRIRNGDLRHPVEHVLRHLIYKDPIDSAIDFRTPRRVVRLNASNLEASYFGIFEARNVLSGRRDVPRRDDGLVVCTRAGIAVEERNVGGTRIKWSIL